MSKYARTRKAICRISHLNPDYWPVSRSYFKKYSMQTWKQGYKKYKKAHIKFWGYNKDKLPRYDVAIKKYIIWRDFPGI